MTDLYLIPRGMAWAEMEQAESVGHDCSDLRKRLDALPEKDLTDAQREEAVALYKEALSLGLPDGFAYEEPSDLKGIRAARPDRERSTGHSLSDAELHDRILGGWLGRAAGCLVGKPVEGWSRERIRELLEKVDAYPLDYYFPEIPEVVEGGYHGRPKSWTRGNITVAPRDDDTDYTILGLHILEKFGKDFTTADVGNVWLDLLPYFKVYTAERVAYYNLVRGLEPPETAVRDNPYREWIGAQIRADGFGYAAPGNPELAAEFGFRDAALSHTANGIYGEMWVAAMLAGAFLSDDVEEVIEIGLAEIPEKSRLTEAIRQTVAWCKKESGWEKVCDSIQQDYGHYHGVHTINNACLVALGMMKAEGDLGLGACISVMGGWDTDCNGATTGSVLGVMMGARTLPGKWVDPLNDTLESIIVGFATNSISDLAARTAEVSRKVS